MNVRELWGVMGLALIVGLASRAIVDGTKTAAIIGSMGSAFSSVINAAALNGQNSTLQ